MNRLRGIWARQPFDNRNRAFRTLQHTSTAGNAPAAVHHSIFLSITFDVFVEAEEPSDCYMIAASAFGEITPSPANRFSILETTSLAVPRCRAICSWVIVISI